MQKVSDAKLDGAPGQRAVLVEVPVVREQRFEGEHDWNRVGALEALLNGQAEQLGGGRRGWDRGLGLLVLGLGARQLR